MMFLFTPKGGACTKSLRSTDLEKVGQLHWQEFNQLLPTFIFCGSHWDIKTSQSQTVVVVPGEEERKEQLFWQLWWWIPLLITARVIKRIFFNHVRSFSKTWNFGMVKPLLDSWQIAIKWNQIKVIFQKIAGAKRLRWQNNETSSGLDVRFRWEMTFLFFQYRLIVFWKNSCTPQLVIVGVRGQKHLALHCGGNFITRNIFQHFPRRCFPVVHLIFFLLSQNKQQQKHEGQ